MSKVVLIGGGTGISSLIRGIKNIENLDISTIIAVSDSGGSTGKLRKSFNIPAVGDIRQVIGAFSENETIANKILQYRFKNSSSELHNHSLGNLIISALIDVEQDFYKGIESISKFVDLKGEVIPSTNSSDITLCAEFMDDSNQCGEDLIPKQKRKIKKVYLKNAENLEVNKIAIDRILNADYIILGIGSLYTSLIANLIIPGIREAIIDNKNAKLIYFCNITTQPGETDGMSAYDHIIEIEKYLDANIIDIVVIDTSKIKRDIIKKYEKSNQFKIGIDQKLLDSHVDVIQTSLADTNSSEIEHSSKKIYKVFKKILNNNY